MKIGTRNDKNTRYFPIEEGGLGNSNKVGMPYIYPNKYYNMDLDGSGSEESDVPFLMSSVCLVRLIKR